MIYPAIFDVYIPVLMKPFLRWAGGKNWLVKHIDKFLSDIKVNNYHEPFLGGGSMFFYLEPDNDCFLSDINKNLINTYEQVRDNVDQVIETLHEYQNTETFYYKVRSKVFENKINAAAQFIYLNQTSFNGIYRVNLKGVYNVPYGHRTKDFIQEKVLKEASDKLKNVNLRFGEFNIGIDNIEEGDLVFLDPPYTITHNNNGFIKYNEKLFSIKDQYRLAEFIRQVVDRGAYYILTNAAHNDIAEIFDFNRPLTLNRASLIGGKNAQRGKYEEFLFTNIKHEFNETN